MGASRRRVDLGEILEQQLLFVAGDADAGVTHHEAENGLDRGFRLKRDSHCHLTGRGELNGVAS